MVAAGQIQWCNDLVTCYAAVGLVVEQKVMPRFELAFETQLAVLNIVEIVDCVQRCVFLRQALLEFCLYRILERGPLELPQSERNE